MHLGFDFCSVLNTGDTGAVENLTRRAEIKSRSDSASLVFPDFSTEIFLTQAATSAGSGTSTEAHLVLRTTLVIFSKITRAAPQHRSSLAAPWDPSIPDRTHTTTGEEEDCPAQISLLPVLPDW